MADGSLLTRPNRTAASAQPRRLDIALVNNMPDAALQATERQFESLVTEAAPGDIEIRLSLYALPSLTRGEAARGVMGDRYGGLDDLKRNGADALIVTGAEPLKTSLRDEVYWDDMTRLIDWARDETVSSLWSCLAAHAAVLHLDGIERLPLPAKCSGVFTFEQTRAAPLTQGLPGLVRIPHSRRNTLDAGELEAKGYQILTHSPKAGVDMFIRQGKSLFVFLQGHPEYDADSLLREYSRDVGRFLRGLQSEYPQSPFGYFDAATERSFRTLAIRARASREVHLLNWCTEIASAMRPARPWRTHAVALYRGWLQQIAAAKAEAGQLQPSEQKA